MTDLPISPEKIAQVIFLARDSSRAAELELRAFIAGLDQDEQAGLVACMWIGRGTFDAADLDEALDTAFAEATAPPEDYLTGTPHLPEHLETGLEAMGIDVTDLENDLMGGH